MKVIGDGEFEARDAIVNVETGEEYTVTAISAAGFWHSVCRSCGAEYSIRWSNPEEKSSRPIVMWGCCEERKGRHELVGR